MITMRVYNSNGAAIESAAENMGGIQVDDIFEPDSLNAETVRTNFDIPVHHMYIGTKLALDDKYADVEYMNIARKDYNEKDIPIVDKNKAGRAIGNGQLVMLNGFRHISLRQPEMFIIEYGCKTLFPTVAEAFMNIPDYYIQKLAFADTSECGIPQKKVKKFIVGTKQPFVSQAPIGRAVKLKHFLSKDAEFTELPQYAKNRMERTQNGEGLNHRCFVIDPETDDVLPPIHAHYAKDKSEIIIKGKNGYRFLTAEEIAKIQGYDESFIFSGSERQKIRQAADSIGVGMAKWLLQGTVKHYFNDCYKSNLYQAA